MTGLLQSKEETPQSACPSGEVNPPQARVEVSNVPSLQKEMEEEKKEEKEEEKRPLEALPFYISNNACGPVRRRKRKRRNAVKKPGLRRKKKAKRKAKQLSLSGGGIRTKIRGSFCAAHVPPFSRAFIPAWCFLAVSDPSGRSRFVSASCLSPISSSIHDGHQMGDIHLGGTMFFIRTDIERELNRVISDPKYSAIFSPESVSNAVAIISAGVRSSLVLHIDTEDDTTALVREVIRGAVGGLCRATDIELKGQPTMGMVRPDLLLFDWSISKRLLTIEVKHNMINEKAMDQHVKQLNVSVVDAAIEEVSKPEAAVPDGNSQATAERRKKKEQYYYGIITTYNTWIFTCWSVGDQQQFLSVHLVSNHTEPVLDLRIWGELVRYIRAELVLAYDSHGLSLCDRS